MPATMRRSGLASRGGTKQDAADIAGAVEGATQAEDALRAALAALDAALAPGGDK